MTTESPELLDAVCRKIIASLQQTDGLTIAELRELHPRYKRRTLLARLKYLEWVGIIRAARKPSRDDIVGRSSRWRYHLVPLCEFRQRFLSELGSEQLGPEIPVQVSKNADVRNLRTSRGQYGAVRDLR